MCLIMTMIAAAVTGGLWIFQSRKGKASKSLFTTVMMFLAAALMWCVDGMASVAGGEGFFDLSAADAVLGVIILAAGAAVYAVLSFFERRKAAA